MNERNTSRVEAYVDNSELYLKSQVVQSIIKNGDIMLSNQFQPILTNDSDNVESTTKQTIIDGGINLEPDRDKIFSFNSVVKTVNINENNNDNKGTKTYANFRFIEKIIATDDNLYYNASDYVTVEMTSMGLGLFAKIQIPSGNNIIKFNGVFLSNKDYSDLSKNESLKN